MTAKTGYIDFSNLEDEPLDPAVEALISKGQRTEAERRLPAKERKAKAKERAKAEARKGARALYDLDPALIAAVKRVAGKTCTTASQVAAVAIIRFLADVEAGKVDLRDYRTPSDSPRYEFNIDLEKVKNDAV